MLSSPLGRGAKPAEVGQLVSYKAAPSAAEVAGGGRWAAGRGSEAALSAAAPGAGAVAWPALSPRGCLRSLARNLLISNARLRLPLRGKGAAPTLHQRALPSLSATHRRWPLSYFLSFHMVEVRSCAFAPPLPAPRGSGSGVGDLGSGSGLGIWTVGSELEPARVQAGSGSGSEL